MILDQLITCLNSTNFFFINFITKTFPNTNSNILTLISDCTLLTTS